MDVVDLTWSVAGLRPRQIDHVHRSQSTITTTKSADAYDHENAYDHDYECDGLEFSAYFVRSLGAAGPDFQA